MSLRARTPGRGRITSSILTGKAAQPLVEDRLPSVELPWLMPIVPPMVSAAAGAGLIAHLPAGQDRLDLDGEQESGSEHNGRVVRPRNLRLPLCRPGGSLIKTAALRAGQ